MAIAGHPPHSAGPRRAERYRIGDEPAGGALARWAVNPIWPLFASMFAGAWLAWPWFVFNGLALGSPTRRRELAWAIGGLAASAGLVWALVASSRSGLLPKGSIRYLVTVLVAWRLAVAYVLYTLQAPVHELHLHFGGPSRSGLMLVIAATFVPWDRLLGEWQYLLTLVLG